MSAISDYTHLRLALARVWNRAEGYLSGKCSCMDCRRELMHALDIAYELMMPDDGDRCPATHNFGIHGRISKPEGVFRCVRYAHEDPEHTAGGGAGTWKDALP